MNGYVEMDEDDAQDICSDIGRGLDLIRDLIRERGSRS